MKPGRPSLTAFYVAFARALATHQHHLARVCQDPIAEQLLPPPLQALLARAYDDTASQTLLRGLSASMFGMVEHLALRTRVIDDAVEQAVALGARNIVILGAGLDARAHRLASLAECTVFEVDFPSTQAFKRARAEALPLRSRAHHYVACDFEQTALDAALLGKGFDAGRKSAWIWEGVTMYLPRASVTSSLTTIARLSAQGSRVIASYLLPTAHEQKLITAVGFAVLGALSEPIRSSFEPEEMALELATHGMGVVRDLAPRQLATRYSVHFPRLSFGVPRERIAVAEKRGSA